MSQKISIIIPVLDEADCLDRLLPGFKSEEDVEVIVVDGGSSDATPLILGKYPNVHYVHAPKGRGIQLNRGASIARGDIVWFLHADSRLMEGWKQEIIQALSSTQVVAGCFHLQFDDSHWLLRLFAFFSRWNHPLATYGDQGYFMRREVFLRIGGFKDYPILEDLEVQCRLRRLGKWYKSPLALITSARRFKTMGILRQQLKNIGIVSLYLAGASPHWLSRFYKPQSQLKESAQSASLKPTALSESLSKKGRLTKLPFSLKS